MIRDDLVPLTVLLMQHGHSLMRTDITCARDVHDELAREYAQPAGEFLRIPHGQASLTGVDVIALDDLEPGRWTMTRHDNCEFERVGMHRETMVVSHKNCTILGESGQEDAPQEAPECQGS